MSQPLDAIPRRADYGERVYRRRIHIECLEERATGGVVVGELEDDFHHFRALITHDGRDVLQVTGQGLRIPWTTCSGSGDKLDALMGAPLLPAAADVAHYADPHLQCTHLYDAAVLAIAVTAQGVSRRIYDAEIPDRRDGKARVTLDCDGERVLEWQVEGMRIVDPAPYAGCSIGEGFVAWSNTTLDLEEAEAAQVLRRAAVIGLGRQYDFDKIPLATGFAQLAGRCHTFHPDRVERAERVHGTVRDLTNVDPATLARIPGTSARGD